MRNVAFAVWMVGFPISNSYSEYVGEYLLGHRYSGEVHAAATFLCLIIWVAVGMALYERK